ncbi:putative gustatory receptor 28b [Tenebrio molitor]|uniref:putative gustatory receptor 28b n=1 Tax=Tenebrio molitor TaxID=7067 RepID=UPI0036248FF8
MNTSKMNEKQFPKFLNGVRLLLVQSQIFGIVTFDYTDKKFQVSRVRCVFSFLAFLFYTSTVSYCVYKTATVTHGPAAIYKTTDILFLVISGTYVGTIWVCAIINNDKLINLLGKLVDFDLKLHINSIPISYDASRRRILLGFLVRYICLTVIIAFYSWYSRVHAKTRILIADWASVFSMVISSVGCHQMTELVLMIKSRFVILNRQINHLISYFRKNNIATVAKKPTRFLALNKICALHHHLTKLVKLFNDTFGVVLLFMFGISFVATVLSLFYGAAELQASKVKWLKLVWSLLACLTYTCDMIYVCHVCYETIEEAKKSGELIHKIETEDHDTRDEMEMFSLQIANEEVEFNAAGFFPINFTLLFSIIGGVTTYMIILIQLSATLSEN